MIPEATCQMAFLLQGLAAPSQGSAAQSGVVPFGQCAMPPQNQMMQQYAMMQGANSWFTLRNRIRRTRAWKPPATTAATATTTACYRIHVFTNFLISRNHRHGITSVTFFSAPSGCCSFLSQFATSAPTDYLSKRRDGHAGIVADRLDE